MQLRACNTGFMTGQMLVNHLMYADDLVIISSAGLQQLVNICIEYGLRHDIKHNASKSAVLICRIKPDKGLNFPACKLSGNILDVCRRIKYLGDFIKDKLDDNDYVYRQC